MRLKKLKVSGFKSFVDLTDIRLPADFVGVVGPNGCGKSNVIDAVRWVMGESSAKMLRGDSMADVIFNGSSSRKPVGKASVELLFDNSAGRASGHYAQFAEISVMRTLSREGSSDYLINRTKSRRRDVIDLFRGTGLGPRSYSIIEQGMVTRIVESKPEELRAFVEEAAGISKYKDRRRETENRIRHTRENLERVDDICGELDKQLRRLQRQASAAKRFKTLKQEERELAGQLAILQLQQLQQQLDSHDRVAAQLENELQRLLAEQRGCEAELEQVRQRQNDSRDQANSIQQKFYAIGAEITNIEQQIEHAKESRNRRLAEIERLRVGRDEGHQQLLADQQRKQQIERDLALLDPEIMASDAERETAEKDLISVESVMRRWENQWDEFSLRSQVPAQQHEVQKSRIVQLSNQLQQVEVRRDRATAELGSLKVDIDDLKINDIRQKVSEHDQQLNASELGFSQSEDDISMIRRRLHDLRENQADLRAQHHEAGSRLHSLREIQTARFADDNDELQQWLQHHQLSDQASLAKRIKVEAGWERAADRLLDDFLNSVCVEHIDIALVDSIPDSSITVITQNSMKKRSQHGSLIPLVDVIVSDDIDLGSLLSGVYIVDSNEQAMALQAELTADQCLVTRDGTLIGSNWVSRTSSSQAATGVLVREEEIKQLEQTMQQLDHKRSSCEQAINTTEDELSEREQRLRLDRSELSRMRADKTSLHNRLGREETRFSQNSERIAQINAELDELSAQQERYQSDLQSAQMLLQSAADSTAALAELKQQLLTEREAWQDRVIDAREAVRNRREQYHEMDLKRQRMVAALESLVESISRLQHNYDLSQDRLTQLSTTFNDSENPVDDMLGTLELHLRKKVEVENQLSHARDSLATFEQRLLKTSETKRELERQVGQARENLNQHKLLRQETIVRRDTLNEHIEHEGYAIDQLRAELPQQASVGEWQQEIDQIGAKIDRIGPVNLVAIEEYQEESERKEYLDKQRHDLVEALTTLETVIRKIDKETKARFRQTFDQLNQGFADFFPRLFGGGKAELLLTSDDLLIAGVGVMARPPGKRNSSIYLLSGGEKALTAVALLFALFNLNPAPFCMLDEVDAPLDDANVERYCKTLRSLSEISQLVVITHNKITMGYADLLVGVTMSEPGVSRLVSVDVGEAIEMAAQ